MRTYDHNDFTANPKKYELFCSADVARNLFGENGDDVPAGTPVAIKFLGVRRNQLYRRNEPVYTLSTGHCVYANALANFIL